MSTGMKKVGLVSLGCAKNRVDAERILGGIAARGFEIVEDLEEAEVVIVNTCGFIREAVEESVEEILETSRLKTEGKCRVLAVSGCLVKRYPEMADELPEVDHFFTPEQIGEIPGLLAGTVEPVLPIIEPARMLTAPPHSTYLKIADGCSNRCRYCTIPLIRGNFVSVDEDKLVEEATYLAGLGAVELNIIAQDVTSYGKDIGKPDALKSLLERLEQIESIKWLRLLYAYPRPLPQGLLELLAGGRGGKILPYLDVPIQHAHPAVLKRMGRRHGEGELERFFDTVRQAVPDIVLRTTAIVGYPGETEEEFEALLSFVDRVGFNHLGAFVYSPEEGTSALEIPDHVPEDEAWERHDRLLSLQAGISAEKNEQFVGRELDVLIEGIDEEGEVLGRTFGQAPEVDGVTRLPNFGDEIIEIGGFVRAKITEAEPYDLIAELVE
jgi:ribosomal protein S12 methylthiotransferase